MKLKLSPLFVRFGLFIIEGLSPNSVNAATNKRILILHSYQQGFHWTDRITQGITFVFEQRQNIELFVNYMDTKRMSSKAYYVQLKELYKKIISLQLLIRSIFY